MKGGERKLLPEASVTAVCASISSMDLRMRASRSTNCAFSSSNSLGTCDSSGFSRFMEMEYSSFTTVVLGHSAISNQHSAMQNLGGIYRSTLFRFRVNVSWLNAEC